MTKKLYIQRCHRTPIKSLIILIDSLYKDAETLNRRCWARPTYLDKDLSEIDSTGFRRSFEDLFCLAKTYFPKTTETELMSVLKELGMMFGYCNDINKIVFSFAGVYMIGAQAFKECLVYKTYDEGSYSAEKLLEIYSEAKL